jgi:hypothetical protein
VIAVLRSDDGCRTATYSENGHAATLALDGNELACTIFAAYGDTALVADPTRQYIVIVGTVDDAVRRDWCLQYNLWETERYIASLDGFRFARFLTASDPRTWAELTCWESTEQFRRAYEDPGFQEHIQVEHHYCETDASLQRVVEVAP